MNDLPNLLESVPPGSTLVALATLSGVAIAGAISYVLDVIRESRSKKQRRTTSSIAASDSLDEFQRICVDKIGLLNPESASVSQIRDNLKSVRLPDLTLRDHPEFLADLPDAEQRALLDLLRQTRDQNSRLDALYRAWKSKITNDDTFILKVSIEKFGFADAAQKAILIQNNLSNYTGWPASRHLIEKTDCIKREAAQLRHELARKTAQNTILFTIDAFAGIHMMSDLFGESKNAFQEWLKTIYGPLFGSDICDAVEKAATEFHETKKEFDTPTVADTAGSKKDTIKNAAKNAITESPIGKLDDISAVISPDELDGIRLRVLNTSIPREFPDSVSRQLKEFYVTLMRDTASDPREMFDPVPKYHHKGSDSSLPSGQ